MVWILSDLLDQLCEEFVPIVADEEERSSLLWLVTDTPYSPRKVTSTRAKLRAGLHEDEDQNRSFLEKLRFLELSSNASSEELLFLTVIKAFMACLTGWNR